MISDLKLINFIQIDIRGRFTFVIRRFVKTKNQHTNPDFNFRTETPNFVWYFHCISLYVNVIEISLPVSEGETSTLLSKDLQPYPTDDEIGYWVLCDTLPVLDGVARRIDHFPLRLENHQLYFSDLSLYTKGILRKEGKKYSLIMKKINK